MEYLIPIAIITVLIALNAIFVAAEFAIVGAPRASIERQAAEGNRAARLVRDVLRDPQRQDRYVATAQLGITVASLGLGMYGEHIVAEWLLHGLERFGAGGWVAAHAIASVLAVSILTYFHVVLGEMIPKSLALSHAETAALRVTGPMLWIQRLVFPLVVALNGVGNALLRLMGVQRVMGASHFHSPEELQLIVEESVRGGQLPGEQGRVLRELFEFGELNAGDVMVPRVGIAAIPLGATPQVMAEMSRTAKHTRYPVFERDVDHVIGFVRIEDILRLLLDGQSLTRDQVRPVPFVPEAAGVASVLESMRKQSTHMVIVMDEHGGTAGAVTMEDLCDEIVGEIEESAAERPPIQEEGPDRWRVAGSVRLNELSEQVGIDVEHEEVETVSGLVLALLGRPPSVGDAVSQSGVRFEVTTVKGRGVQECLVARESK